MKSTCLLTTLSVGLTVASCTRQDAEPVAFSPMPTLIRFDATLDRGQNPDWSPDGRWIAVDATTSGNTDIWINSTSGGAARQITRNPAIDRVPRWSPDGEQLLFVSNRGGHWNVWTISPLDGEETATRVTADADSVFSFEDKTLPASWSPDGQQIVFTSSRSGNKDLWIIPATGGTARQLTARPEGVPDSQSIAFGAWDPDWSPDGQSIAFSMTLSGPEMATLWTVPAAGGTTRQLTASPQGDWNASYSPDGKWIAFCSTGRSGTSDAGEFDLWMIPAAGGTPTQLTNTPGHNEVGPRWSPDGQGLVYESPSLSGKLWMMTDGGRPDQVTGRDAIVASFTPDGREIAFIGQGPEGRDVWKMPAAGGESVRLTEGGTVAGGFVGLRVAPDGKHIAFTSRKGGNKDVWTLPADGGRLRRITITSGDEVWMSYSPDSRRIAHTSRTEDGWDIWIVPAAGGVAERLVDWPTTEWGPDWSPDGDRIAFTSRRAQTGEGNTRGDWHIWVVSATSGGEATYVTGGEMPEWSRDGRALLFVRDSDIWSIPAAGGPATRLTETPEAEAWPRFSPDGRRILFVRTEAGFIWIADLSGLGILR